MAVPLLDLRAQYATIKDEIARAITGILEAQTFILGEPVSRLESAVAELSHAKFAVGCASGTDALILALRALDLSPGDEVITTPFTFFATASSVHLVGAKPVFVDIDPVTFNIDPALAAAAVTPRTRAIIPVDIFGQMAALEQIGLAIPGLPMIEDAAQSIGARRSIDGEWRMAGETATMGTLSFFPSKNLGAYGDGGMILTQDERLRTRLLRLRAHGGSKTYYHEEVGYNSRLDALQAAVLQAKLPHLADWSARRRAHAAYYTSALSDLAPRVRTPVVETANESIFNQYTIRAERRDDLQAHLKARGIGTAIYYPLPLHLQPCFGYLGYRRGQLPEAERASAEVISLPVYPELSQAQQDEVIRAVREFYAAA
jgi:dTDP-4-amino-4,6-dideoxygalactose transaminase